MSVDLMWLSLEVRYLFCFNDLLGRTCLDCTQRAQLYTPVSPAYVTSLTGDHHVQPGGEVVRGSRRGHDVA